MIQINVILAVMLFGAFVVSICIHESAHALAALALGDSSPRNDGRVSLNPLRQLTALGTAVALVLSFLSTLYLVGAAAGLALGWGQPVRFDALKLRFGPNVGTVLVALAGPLANLVLGVGCAFVLGAIPQSQHFFIDGLSCLNGSTGAKCLSDVIPWWQLRGEQLLFAFVVVNLGLFLINLIPLYPLDGYRVLFALLPSRQAVSFRRAEPYMELIVLGLLFLLPMIISFSGAGELAYLSPFYWIFRGTLAIATSLINPLYPIIFYQT
jgi:Zn-dependent protease